MLTTHLWIYYMWDTCIMNSLFIMSSALAVQVLRCLFVHVLGHQQSPGVFTELVSKHMGDDKTKFALISVLIDYHNVWKRLRDWPFL